MYPTYAFRTGPCAGRHLARRGPQQARAFSGGFFPPAVFGGARHHPFFGPPTPRSRGDVFDHFDDFVNRSIEGLIPGAHASARSNSKAWQPRFDVQEVEHAYQLRGELPGVDVHDLSVEFTDANTLVIRGRTQSEYAQGQPPAQVQAEITQDHNTISTATDNPAQAQEGDKSDAASVHSDTSYVRPSVEDEADVARHESVVAPTGPTTDSQQASSQHNRYWVSERRTGSFSRTFEFSGRVDADNVTASLKKGILDVTVPKAKVPEARKVEVK